MSQDINIVVIVGRIVRDAELKYSSSGTAICNFSIASNRSVKRGDKWEDEASFLDLTLWSKQAEGLNKYLTKGQQVVVKGELKQERWSKDGQNHSKLSISVDSVQLIGSSKDSSSNKPQSNSYSDNIPERENDFSDVPF
jgi:single-strand DNA-binding protein